jgi:hypothetical protein
MHIDAYATSIDLARSKFAQNTAFFRRGMQSAQVLKGIGKNHCGIIHSRFHYSFGLRHLGSPYYHDGRH